MFDPVVERWFRNRFGSPTEPQALGWPEIRAGRDVLISAPTGSGKTLAAFLIAIDGLVRKAHAGALRDEIEVVYVSPLKALSNDIHKNLETPLAELALTGTLRAAVRTGDTPAWKRQEMGRRPPHILVTTPESLFILLTSPKARLALRTVRAVIVDEIHAVADDKRGSHLALTLARLDALALARPQRVGLSATVKPVEQVAEFLAPGARIVNVGHRRDMDLAIEVPKDELGPIATNELWAGIYSRIAELIAAHRTTLVFVNTRRLAERVAHNLTERLGEGRVLPHHGSLSRKLRLDAEARLKAGELRAVVATASLELGIDIGTVDLVCQVGSPRSIAAALQRIGRSGHWRGATPKGRLFAITRDDLVECAALVRALRGGELDRLEIPQAPLDILAQQIVAACGVEDWAEDSLFSLVRQAYPYRALPRAEFDAIVEMLAEGIVGSRGRSGAYLHRDRVNGRVRGRRGARLAAITSGGAIPDTSNYTVVAEPEGAVVGMVDEEFAMESVAGDVFLLGTHSWRIRRVEAGRVRVEDAHGSLPGLPFWHGEAPGRTLELSREVAWLRSNIEAVRECGVDRLGGDEAIAYVEAGRKALGATPSLDTVVAERFFDEAGGMQLVIHAPFGGRINRAWGLALRRHFAGEVQAAATDNGVLVSLTERHAFPLEAVFEFVREEEVESDLAQMVLESPMFAARWRWNVTRALAVLRQRGGKRVPAPIQRMRSEDLLAAAPPDHPLWRQTIFDCLHEAMDVDGLRAVLRAIARGEIRTVAVDMPQASPFSHEIVNSSAATFLDNAPLQERRARAVQLRSALREDFAGGEGVLDAAAIEQVSREAWPLVRDADELHDALLTLVRLRPAAGWEPYFAELAAAGRARLVDGFWTAVERQGASGADAVRGWMESSGPVTAEDLSGKLGMERAEVERALEALEAEGLVLRGNFSGRGGEWCGRRLLARIHRLTIGKLRREIEPVTTAEYETFLERWQRLAPGTQLHGADGAFEVIRQWQGFEFPAASWETEVLPRRVAAYRPEYLDELCLSGDVMWGRLSHAVGRVRPTRVSPVALFLREDAAWLVRGQAGEEALTHAAREVLEELRRRGACFFAELTRATGRLASEVEDGLWELAASGLVTADGFENLRALFDPKRRRGEGRGRHARPRHAAGRWAVLRAGADPPPDACERFARQWLLRWGVLFRDVAVKEPAGPPWRDVLVQLRRMEARGEVRGGRFVAAYLGEQFALPEALDLLRAVRRGAVL
ncbi:MAG: DEAD/DEAH box helicase [Bryobacteraceae bacterium]